MINSEGLAIIKAFEGWSATPYRCPANVWTIGYGSTWEMDGSPITGDHTFITEDYGEALLRRELRHVYSAIRRLVNVPLNEDQYSSLCSFIYNVGSGNFQSSTLRMKLNRYDYWGASQEFKKWRMASGRVLKGLVRRRVSETALFLS